MITNNLDFSTVLFLLFTLSPGPMFIPEETDLLKLCKPYTRNPPPVPIKLPFNQNY